MIDLRQGDWREVLADVEECDAVITDPPYSPRVHAGQRTGSETAKSQIVYDAISPEMCRDFAEFWASRVRWWVCIFSDHLGSRWWEEAWQLQGWYVFSPVGWVRRNATPRVAGDGPTSAIDYITVARPRHRLPKDRSGSRPGSYLVNVGAWNIEHVGGKPVMPMRAIVRDYTLRGDLIVDPYAGGGTTLLAAETEGRRAIGAELDPDTHALALSRLRRPRELTFDFEGAAP